MRKLTLRHAETFERSDIYEHWLDQLWDLMEYAHFQFKKLEELGLEERDVPHLKAFKREVEKFLLMFAIDHDLATAARQYPELQGLRKKRPVLKNKTRSVLDEFTG